jgi:tRNA-dihydrouridine synthase B
MHRQLLYDSRPFGRTTKSAKVANNKQFLRGELVLQIANICLDSQALLAPMAGVTDLPFRSLCRKFGAGLTTSEMITSQTKLWNSKKSRQRLVVVKQNYPVSMQIAGNEAIQLAEAAQQCVNLGAEIIDINVGCPAKKVCKKAAGSALLGDLEQLEKLIKAVVDAVDVPVTLKTRTGLSPENRNGIDAAKIAEQCGVAAVAIHGRTRACRFNGHAEYDSIAEIVDALSIPVLANGDITSAAEAKSVLEYTGAQGILIGRAALGRPWLFAEINAALDSVSNYRPLATDDKKHLVLKHIQALHEFYGEYQGVRIARKHFAWYCEHLGDTEARKKFNLLETAKEQLVFIHNLFNTLKNYEDQAA